MDTVNINGVEFYTEADLKKADPAFFFGCSRNRSMVLKEKKNIPKEDYIYAYQKKKTNEWIVCSEDYKPGKLLVSRTWVEENVPALRSKDSENATESKYQMAPEILELEEEEKFRDKDGNVLEIEVRGEKHYKKCYFLVSDVREAFGLKNLDTTIQHKEYGYSENIHYKVFICPGLLIQQSRTIKKYLFLTYRGMVKALYSSRSSNAEAFQDWATEKLFTLQMGEQDQKDEMASDLIGVSPKTIADVFRKNTEKTPCVYLFKVKKESEDEFICKFGLTNDLPRRTKDHQNKYTKELKWGTIELIYFSIIDPKFLSDAETCVKRMLRPYSYSYENQTELVRLKKEDLKDIKTHYQMIQKSYLGCYQEMLDKIQKLETDLKIQELEFQQKVKDEKTARERVEIELKHQHDFYEQKIELLEQKNRADLLAKELELERLRHRK